MEYFVDKEGAVELLNGSVAGQNYVNVNRI